MMYCLTRAAHGTAMILMILLGASIFGYFFALTQVTQQLVHWVSGLGVSPWLIIAAMLVGYLILGCFLDQTAILFLTVPIVLPIIVSLGFDPIWFGVIKIVTAEVGLITPPLGLNCYVVSRYSGLKVEEVYRGSFPHFIAHIFVIILLVAFPEIILWLPRHMQ
jgi:TRAP-type C4-dicarboxylate transport system permease large subunit